MQATRRLKRRDDASTVGDIVGLLSPQLSKKNLASLCTRLLAMFEAGIPPARCFALIEESESRDLRRLARAVRNDIEHGATLAEAVRARGRALPAFFVEMIAAAEEAGALETALRSLADDYEAQVAHRRAFQQALTYPICIAVAAVVVIPMFSMVMLGASARQAGIFLARSLIAPAMVLSVWSAWNHFGPTRPSRAGMRAPLRNVSWIARTYDMANALRALAALYASGLSLPRCLERAAALSTNPPLRAMLQRAGRSVADGATLYESLSTWRGFPRDTLNLIRVGEQSGKLDSALDHAARALREAAAHRLRIWLVSLESILILALGVWIAAGVR